MPAEEKDSHVVVPVEEDELVLSQHDEHSVDELGHLGIDEKHRPEASSTKTEGRLGRGADLKADGQEKKRQTSHSRNRHLKLPLLSEAPTHRKVKALLVDGVKKVGRRSDETDGGENCKQQVPQLQGTLELEGLSAGHDLLPNEAEKKVNGTDDERHVHISFSKLYETPCIEVDLWRTDESGRKLKLLV
jgi:hypothetical protein